MTLTADALWLNTAFAGYDQAILSFAHRLAEIAGAVLTPLNKLITLLGEKGLLFFLLAVMLMLIPRYRRTGVCIFGAVCCGALITNIILKDHVARPRPFETVELYRQWWQYVGAPAEDGFSFPSGHVTAAAAGCTSLCLMRGKKWILPGAIWVLLMMFSRNYLMAHYPSDVLYALLIGVFSGFVAAAITQLIFRFLEKRQEDSRFCSFLLTAGFAGVPDLRGVSKARAERKERAANARAVQAEEEQDAYDEGGYSDGYGASYDTYDGAESAGYGTSYTEEEPEYYDDAPAEEPAEEAPRRERATRGSFLKRNTGSGSERTAAHVAKSDSGKKSRRQSGTYQGKH